jgi:hypothetical protein
MNYYEPLYYPCYLPHTTLHATTLPLHDRLLELQKREDYYRIL